MGNLISSLMKWAIFLAAIGQLKPAIMYFAWEAAREQQRGLISLSAFNRSLFDEAHAKMRKSNGHYGVGTRPPGQRR